MNKIIISTITASLLTISSAQAFDDQREGFLMSFGAGLSSVNSELTAYNNYYGNSFSIDERSLGFATAFKIGYGFNNQFLLYYTNDVSWFGIDAINNNDTFITGGSAIGASYYIDENGPIYITGAIGLGIFSNFSSGDSADLGSTFSVGAGYEITPHVQLEATWQHTSTENYSDYYSDTDVTTNALRFTINYMWY